MPVYLDAIPDVAPDIQRPDTWRWMIALAAILVTGSGLTFWLWADERAGVVFWFSALGLPFCVWGLLFSLRRFSYKCDRVWATSWDRERSRLLAQETARGQRAARVLDSGVITQSGSGAEKLRTAMQSGTSLLTMQPSRSGGRPVRHARLPGFVGEGAAEDFDALVKTVVSHAEPLLACMPANIACWLMADCAIAGIANTDVDILQALTLQTGRPFRLLPVKGLAAVDVWLDEAWRKPAMLLCVSAEVRTVVQNDDGETFAWMLLLNRPHVNFPDAVALHRPEKGALGTLSKTLAGALLWTRIRPQEIKGAWTTGKRLADGGEWVLACERGGLTLSMTDENKDVDQITGYTGRAAPWLALSLAIAAVRESGPQIIVAETITDEIWIAGVTPAGQPEVNQGLS